METIHSNNQPENKKNKVTALLVVFFVLSIFFASIFGAFFGFISAELSPQISAKIGKELNDILPDRFKSNSAPQENKQQVLVEDSAVIDVVNNSSPAVVSVIISKNRSQIPSNAFDPFSQFFGGDQNGDIQPTPNKNSSSSQKQQIGAGTGFFITPDGLIATNKHVVEDTDADYSVMTNDGKEYPAKVLARDLVQDVAILKIDGAGFPVLPLGDSDKIQIGQTVVAIGNSLGEFTNSVSRGIVSGLKRSVSAGSSSGSSEQLTNIIQTDAAINPGNSGGPLLNIEGSVIGVNVAMAQGAQNIGFALPINQIKRIIDQVKTTGKISAPFLGVRYVIVDKNLAEQNQLPFDYGVLIMRGSSVADLAIIPGSPADKAGLAENDIILEADGQKITADNQLSGIISNHSVGDTISLKVWHKGQLKDVSVVLAENKQ